MHSKKQHIVLILCVCVFFGAILSGCTQTGGPGTPTPSPTGTVPQTTVPVTSTTVVPTTPVPPANPNLRIATTTSLYDTKLLDAMETFYEAKSGVNLQITSQGTGKAIELAKRGDTDILLVHSPSQETAFLETAGGLNQRCIAYNYFMIVGPANDPAGIRGLAPEKAFAKILTDGKKGTPGVFFISRGDASGTHTAEQNLWKLAGYTYATQVQKSGAWYIETGRGMGETLTAASEKGGYTLTDEGTFLAFKSNLNLVPIIDQGPALLNRYSVMVINPVKQPATNIEEGNKFITWLVSTEGQQFIGDYGKDKYGKGLFTPLGADVCTAAPFSCDCTSPATATTPVRVFAAGSLSSPFTKVNALLESRRTDIDALLYTGGSVDMINKVTAQNGNAQVLASADYYLIPQKMIPGNASWYINFARNRMVLVYSDRSRSAGTITANNWPDVLRQDGVTYMISDPNTDPAGYRALMTIKLAEQAYGNSGIFESLITSHSNITVRPDPPLTTIAASIPKPDNRKFFIGSTATEVVNGVKNGSIDYAFEYVSVAKQNGLKYVDLPASADLSTLTMESTYAKVRVETQKSGVTAFYTGSPIVYGVTVPSKADTPELGIEFVKLLISTEGQKIISDDGQEPLSPMLGYGNVPGDLRPLVTVV